MTLEQLSPFPSAVEEVAFSLTPGWPPQCICISDLKSCQLDVFIWHWLLPFQRSLFPNYAFHAHHSHEEHPEISVQRLGFFFNLFSFNFWWCSIVSYGSSLVFCRRGSNSLLGCAESFTWSFLTSSPSLLTPLEWLTQLSSCVLL